jgi:hypothetical protein
MAISWNVYNVDYKNKFTLESDTHVTSITQMNYHNDQVSEIIILSHQSQRIYTNTEPFCLKSYSIFSVTGVIELFFRLFSVTGVIELFFC